MMTIRMLLVDDSPELLEMMESMYRFRSVDIVGTARGNDEAHTILKRKPVDIVSIDIYMGEYCGFDLCRDIHRTMPEVFITMCSSEMSCEMKAIASSSGSHYCLGKPFGLADVEELVRAYYQWTSQVSH